MATASMRGDGRTDYDDGYKKTSRLLPSCLSFLGPEVWTERNCNSSNERVLGR